VTHYPLKFDAAMIGPKEVIATKSTKKPIYLVTLQYLFKSEVLVSNLKKVVVTEPILLRSMWRCPNPKRGVVTEQTASSIPPA
jgi:hypothetical protein